MERRQFIQMTGAATLYPWLSAASAQPQSSDEPKTNKLPTRIFGKTGVRVPILGLGCASAGYALPDEKAISLFHKAIDMGVTYFDSAHNYGRAQIQLAPVLKERRDEVFLVTKMHVPDYATSMAHMEENLKTMGVEQVDVTFIHNLGEYDIDQVLGPQGALKAVREMKRRGWARFIGFTAHNYPWKSAKMIRETDDLDVTMLAMNFADRNTYNFEGKVLPHAIKKNLGVACMKVFGGPNQMRYAEIGPSSLEPHAPQLHELALRHALSLPGVAVAVVGMHTEEQIIQNVETVKRYKPLTNEEVVELEKRGPELADKWGLHYGPVV